MGNLRRRLATGGRNDAYPPAPHRASGPTTTHLMKTYCLSSLAVALGAASLSAQWNLAAPAASPTARSGASMVFDPIAGRAVLFGGTTGFSTSNQTWAYDGTTWTQLTPTTSPTGKTGMQLVYDAGRGVIVMFGSNNTSPFGGASVNQHWEFNGTTWTQIFPAATPGGRGNYGACYDVVRSRVVLYGGVANSMFPIAESGTWEFDGTTWAQITTVGSPGPLERPAMCYHLGIAKAVLFGGIDPQIGGTDTTWLYDGTTWTAAVIAGAKPAVRTGARLVYDTVRDVSVLSGGLDPNTGAPILDTWEFNGASWTQIPTAAPGRLGQATAFLPTIRQVVQFGGMNPTTFADQNDTWHYGAKVRTFGAGCAGSNGVPALAANDAPRLGQNYTLTLTNLVPSSTLAILVAGLSDQTGPFGPLPASLAGFGMPGCSALVSSDVVLFLGTSGGSAVSSLAIPNAVGFVGLTLFHQGVSFDAAANAGGLTVSNAVAGTLGQ